MVRTGRRPLVTEKIHIEKVERTGRRPLVTDLICSKSFSCSSGYNANNANAKHKVFAVVYIKSIVNDQICEEIMGYKLHVQQRGRYKYSL